MTWSNGPRATGPRGAVAAAIAVAALLAVSTGVSAQVVFAPVEDIDFDRPEAWGLKYFTSATLMGGLDISDSAPRGSVTLGMEAGWLPTLSPAQQQIGFNGTAPEDLNKAPVFIRLRARIGLSSRLSLIMGGAPPVRAFGVTPRLFAAGLEWAVYDEHDWRIVGRVHGQVGTVTGAFTCPSDVLGFEPGSPNNPRGCEAESNDVSTLQYVGLEMGAARRLAAMHGLAPHASAGVTWDDVAFQVDARTFGFIDHTRLQSSGATFFVTTGAGIPVTRRLALSFDVFYAPLSVRRYEGAPQTTDGLLNLRALVSYRVH
jgi:hypothetical protein